MDIIGTVITFIVLTVIMIALYERGYSNGVYKERMHLLAILKSIPIAKYDIRYNVVYVVDYIINKMKEE
jgi:uncharacterized membrane protein